MELYTGHLKMYAAVGRMPFAQGLRHSLSSILPTASNIDTENS